MTSLWVALWDLQVLGWVAHECYFLEVAVWDLHVGVGLFVSVLSCGWQCGIYRLVLGCL